MDELRFIRNVLITLVFGAVLLIGGCLRYGPEYKVWHAGMNGQAELAQAEQNRQVQVAASKAKAEAAKYEADAEIARALGIAKANSIMSKSLDGPGTENYLRLRWIMMLEDQRNTSREVIYVPSNGALPIPEAGRAVVPH